MKKRKKQVIDGIDREILRILYCKRPLVSRQIANKVGLTSSAIKPRLNSLKDKGFIKIVKTSAIRCFEREYGDKKIKIKSPRNIFWDLNLKNE